MTKEVLFAAIGGVDAALLDEARAARRRIHWRAWSAAAACLVLLLGAAVLLRQGAREYLTLSDLSHGASAWYLAPEDVPDYRGASSALVPRTEEELRTQSDLAIRGQVRRLDNIAVQVGTSQYHWALAEVDVTQVLRGEAAQTVRVLVQCPVNAAEEWVEDTDVIARLRIGAEGIFLLQRYGADSVLTSGGGELCLADLAPYGFWDGMRFLFLDTPEGLVYAQSAYPSLAGARTLDDVAAWLKG